MQKKCRKFCEIWYIRTIQVVQVWGEWQSCQFIIIQQKYMVTWIEENLEETCALQRICPGGCWSCWLCRCRWIGGTWKWSCPSGLPGWRTGSQLVLRCCRARIRRAREWLFYDRRICSHNDAVITDHTIHCRNNIVLNFITQYIRMERKHIN